MILYRNILVTSIATIVALLCFMAISVSPAWAQTELTVDKRGPATIEKGQVIVYEIDVKNTGDGSAEEVALEDAVPDGTEFVSVSPVGNCGEVNDTVTCEDLGPITANRPSVSITVQVRADGTKDTITNTATATAKDNAGKNLKDSDTVTTKLGSGSGNNSDPNDDSENGSDASADAVKLTCEQLIKLSQGDAAASQYSIEVSQKCEGSANVVSGTVPGGTLADTGGSLFGLLVAGIVLAGSGMLLRTIRR